MKLLWDAKSIGSRWQTDVPSAQETTAVCKSKRFDTSGWSGPIMVCSLYSLHGPEFGGWQSAPVNGPRPVHHRWWLNFQRMQPRKDMRNVEMENCHGMGRNIFARKSHLCYITPGFVLMEIPSQYTIIYYFLYDLSLHIFFFFIYEGINRHYESKWILYVFFFIFVWLCPFL